MTWTADDAPWWTRAVVYQIYPRSFQDSDGDGIGDLRGVLRRLDHLAELGVDVVWFSPLYVSPQDDNGYDIADYQDIDPLFGDLATFDEVVAGLHERGIKVLMDLVVNHTSDEHPWFVASRSSADDPKRDWYWWRPAREGMAPGTPGAEPTNWGSFFSGPAWEYDQATGEYYLHLFSRKQPDLNWENPQVREAVFAMMRWWLDRGVDGFRMDVINLISKVLPLADGPVHGGVLGDGSGQYMNGPRIHEFLAQMHREVFAGRPGSFLTVGEMPGVTIEEARLFTDPARGEVDMVFQFEHVGLDHGPGGKFDPHPLRLTDLKASFGRWQAGLAGVGWNSLYWDNHDQPRIVSRWGDESPASAKALATLLHLHRGTPYVYQGEELGMTNAHLASLDDYRDIESVNHVAAARATGTPDELLVVGLGAMSRDNARTPVQWDASPHAGFTEGTPWLPVNPNHVTLNAAAQRDDEDSVFHHHRRLIALRHDEPVVALGDFTMLLPDDEQVYAFSRSLGDEHWLVAVNLSGRSAVAALADTWGEQPDELVLGTHADPAAAVGGDLTLRPWEAVVRRRRERSLTQLFRGTRGEPAQPGSEHERIALFGTSAEKWWLAGREDLHDDVVRILVESADEVIAGCLALNYTLSSDNLARLGSRFTDLQPLIAVNPSAPLEMMDQSPIGSHIPQRDSPLPARAGASARAAEAFWREYERSDHPGGATMRSVLDMVSRDA